MKPVLLIFNNSNRVFLKQHHKLIVCVVLLLVTVVVVALGFISINASGGVIAKVSASTRSNIKANVTEALLNNPIERVPVALITIRPTGFDPPEITVREGLLLLAIDNKSGLDAVKLRLSREGLERALTVNLSSGRHKWREKMNLPAGTYVVTEADHPDWRCRLTVAR